MIVCIVVRKPASLDMVAQRLNRIALQPERDLKPIDFYRSVELPAAIEMSDLPQLHIGIQRMHTGSHCQCVRGRLDQVAANSRLAVDVRGPDGALLLPAGTILTSRLLNLLHDLHPLDNCVAKLAIRLETGAA